MDPIVIAKILGCGFGVWLAFRSPGFFKWVEQWQHEELKNAQPAEVNISTVSELKRIRNNRD